MLRPDLLAVREVSVGGTKRDGKLLFGGTGNLSLWLPCHFVISGSPAKKENTPHLRDT